MRGRPSRQSPELIQLLSHETAIVLCEACEANVERIQVRGDSVLPA